MVRCTCIEKYKKGNIIVGYLLQTEAGETLEVTPDQLKTQMSFNKVEVNNLKLTSDGRLIDMVRLEQKSNYSSETFGGDFVPFPELMQTVVNKLTEREFDRSKYRVESIQYPILERARQAGRLPICDFPIVVVKHPMGTVWCNIITYRKIRENGTFHYAIIPICELRDKNNNYIKEFRHLHELSRAMLVALESYETNKEQELALEMVISYMIILLGSIIESKNQERIERLEALEQLIIGNPKSVMRATMYTGQDFLPDTQVPEGIPTVDRSETIQKLKKVSSLNGIFGAFKR